MLPSLPKSSKAGKKAAPRTTGATTTTTLSKAGHRPEPTKRGASPPAAALKTSTATKLASTTAGHSSPPPPAAATRPHPPGDTPESPCMKPSLPSSPPTSRGGLQDGGSGGAEILGALQRLLQSGATKGELESWVATQLSACYTTSASAASTKAPQRDDNVPRPSLPEELIGPLGGYGASSPATAPPHGRCLLSGHHASPTTAVVRPSFVDEKAMKLGGESPLDFAASLASALYRPTSPGQVSGHASHLSGAGSSGGNGSATGIVSGGNPVSVLPVYDDDGGADGTPQQAAISTNPLASDVGLAAAAAGVEGSGDSRDAALSEGRPLSIRQSSHTSRLSKTDADREGSSTSPSAKRSGASFSTHRSAHQKSMSRSSVGSTYANSSTSNALYDSTKAAIQAATGTVEQVEKQNITQFIAGRFTRSRDASQMAQTPLPQPQPQPQPQRGGGGGSGLEIRPLNSLPSHRLSVTLTPVLQTQTSSPEASGDSRPVSFLHGATTSPNHGLCSPTLSPLSNSPPYEKRQMSLGHDSSTSPPKQQQQSMPMGPAASYSAPSTALSTRTPAALLGDGLSSPSASNAAAVAAPSTASARKTGLPIHIVPLVEVFDDAAIGAAAAAAVSPGGGVAAAVASSSSTIASLGQKPGNQLHRRSWGGMTPTSAAAHVFNNSGTSITWMPSNIASEICSSPSHPSPAAQHRSFRHHSSAGGPSGTERDSSFVSNCSSHLSVGYADGKVMATFEDELCSTTSQNTAASSFAELPNRRRRSSVLHISHISVNGGVDPLMDGVMPNFILDDGGAEQMSGPRFVRTFCRHTPVHVETEQVRQRLAALKIPYLEGIESAGSPPSLVTTMQNLGCLDSAKFFVIVCMNVLLRYHFTVRFGWDAVKLLRFWQTAATFFRRGNPFHHPIHAADAVLAAHQWLSEGSTATSLSDEELMAFLLASAVIHLANTGADNRFLTRLKHPFAMLCSYTAPHQCTAVALTLALMERPELHFFPSNFTTAAALEGLTPTTPTSADILAPRRPHEWTPSIEEQLYDMLAELVMATDDRGHAAVLQGVMSIAEDNNRRHGCFCASPRQRFHSPLQDAFGSGSSLSPNGPSQLSPPGQICEYCCAYVTDAHIPSLLKGVLRAIDYAFIFRPYDIYITGCVMFIAELYRQSETECRILQALHGSHLNSTIAAAAAALMTSSSPPPPNLDTPADAGRAGTKPEIESTVAALGQDEDVLSSFCDLPLSSLSFCSAPATNIFTAVLLAERQPWREGAIRKSTLSQLRQHAGDAVPSGGSISYARPRRSTAQPGNGSVRPSTLTIPTTAAAAAAGGHSVGANIPGSRSSTRTSASGGASAELEDGVAGACVNPLRGLGRDILLMCTEELSLPYLQQMSPYSPAAWVERAYINYQTFAKSLPSAEAFDDLVEEMLDMDEMPLTADRAARAEERQVRREKAVADAAAEGGDAALFSSIIPFDFIRSSCPISSHWSINNDGLIQRVVQALLSNIGEVVSLKNAE